MKKLACFSIAALLLFLALPIANSFASGNEEWRDKSCFDGSRIPGYPDVIGEYLQIPGTDAPGTPHVLNTAAFLRVRTALDGDRPKPANAIVVAQPGFSSLPTHWLYLAAQLVNKASQRTCDGAPCRVEVWVMDRRGSNLEDTVGLRQARVKYDPEVALDYYFGPSVLTDPTLLRARPGNFPLIASQLLVGRPDAKWKPLLQADLPFMADWSFEAYAGDIEAMINLIAKTYQPKSVFLAGHSQGGGFVANYAGRRQKDGSRGYENLAGLIFLDGGPSAGTNQGAPTPTALTSYFDRVNRLRTGVDPVYTDATGAIGALSGPAAGAKTCTVGIYHALTPDAESIFAPLWGYGSPPWSWNPPDPSKPAPGMAFLAALRLTNLAFAGMGFDVDPYVKGSSLQIPVLSFLGEGLGQLDFTPMPGTEGLCDIITPTGVCIPSAAQVDPNKVYGWLEAGGGGHILTKVGNAKLWQAANGYAPALTNVRPVTVHFPVSGKKTLDAGDMNPKTFYPSERYESDMTFLGGYHIYNIHEQGVNLDINKDEIAGIPAYVAHRTNNTAVVNPFPGVTDFTEINNKGVFQTPAAAAITPFDPKINTSLYFHTDFVSSDDSLAGSLMPGQPGASVVADTLVDWMLARSEGRAPVPTPKHLGVYKAH